MWDLNPEPGLPAAALHPSGRPRSPLAVVHSSTDGSKAGQVADGTREELCFLKERLCGVYTAEGWGWKYKHEDRCRHGNSALQAHAESFISATSDHDHSYGADSSHVREDDSIWQLDFY